jgi:hypothetical protein
MSASRTTEEGKQESEQSREIFFDILVFVMNVDSTGAEVENSGLSSEEEANREHSKSHCDVFSRG